MLKCVSYYFLKPFTSQFPCHIVLVAQGGYAEVRRTARLLNHTPFTAAFQDNAAHRATHAFQNQLASIVIRIIVASAASVSMILVEHVVSVHVCKQFGVCSLHLR